MNPSGGITARVRKQALTRITGIFPFQMEIQHPEKKHLEVNMNRQSFIVCPTLLLIFVFSAFTLADGEQKSVDEYNVPNEIDICIKKIPSLSISAEVNPFYLSGDF